MAHLFLLEVQIEYCGVEFNDFLKIWLEDCAYYLKEAKANKVKQLWKVVAERKFYIVIEETADLVDKMMLETPLMKKLGSQVKVKVAELLPYEKFANNINKIICKTDTYDVSEPIDVEGMYFWAQFDVEYSGFSQKEFLEIWSEEAAVAMEAKKAGHVVDLWKSVGERRVYGLLNFESFEMLDEIIFQLPIMRKNGHNIDLKVKPLRNVDNFAKYLKSIIE